MDWASFTVGGFLVGVLLFAATAGVLRVILRRWFLSWMVVRALVVGLLVLTFPPIGEALFSDPRSLLIARYIATDLSLAVVGPLMATYLERSVEAPLARRLLWAMAPVGLVLALVAPLNASVTVFERAHDATILMLIILAVSGLTLAIRAGSRAAAFQACAWGMSVLVGLAAVYCKLVLDTPLPLYTQLLLVAFVLELVITTAGIGDRLMVVARERDQALKEMRAANEASSLDPLTGIANRRGLKWHFLNSATRPRGLAVIDCDLFKRINDNFGHDTGDRVLVAAGAAIGASDGIFPARLGGEEFVILLYSQDWQRDAEAARRNISAVVARRVPDLPFPVTASAGLSAILPDDSLESAIKRADRALYAAKDAGRDRSIALTDFRRHFTRLEEIG